MSHYYWWTVRDSPGFCSTLHLQKSSSEVAALGTDPLMLVQEKRMLMLAFNEPLVLLSLYFFFYSIWWTDWKKLWDNASVLFSVSIGWMANSFVMVYMNAINDKMTYEGLEEVSHFKCRDFYLGALKRRGNKERWADRYRVTSSTKKLTLWYSAVYFLWQYYRWKSQFQ